jgi:hypothetical protein
MAGFLFLDPELLGSRSGSSSISRRSSVSGSSSVSSRSSGVSSGSFSSRRFSRSSGFFFLAASGHGNSQQSSQEDGIFHLISLYIRI